MEITAEQSGEAADSDRRHKSEELFRNLADNMPVPIWISDDNFKEGLYFNKVWRAFTGRALEEEVGSGWLENVYPDDVTQLLAVCSTAFRNREPFQHRFRMRHKDGDYRWVLDTGVPRYAPDGAFLGFIGSCMDVTDPIYADEARAYLAAIVESSDDAIISKNFNSIVQFWNKGAEQIFGYTEDEMIGQSILKLIPEYLQHEEDEIIAKLRNGKRVDHYETKRMTKDGRLIDISLTVSPVRNKAGQIIGASKIARDITAQKRAEQEKIELVQQLQEADRRKNEFLATLAHELRNPLAPISNAIEIMQLTDDEGIKEESVEIIKRQQQHLTRLVDDLLDISRITRGKLKVTFKPLQLRDVIGSAVETARPLVEERNHELVLDLPDDPVTINGDFVRLSQIFSNLLNNAAKYTEPGGRITVTVRTENQNVIIAVRDTGIGIPRDKLPTIFDMFTQADSSLERFHSGLGVGLTLVEKLAALHGGSVQAFSEGTGKGSEFIVRLPLAAETRKPVSDQDKPTQAADSGRRYRILVVDDNEAVAKTTARMLELLGHELRTAHNGASAMETGKTFKPDVVLLDIGLPGENGYDICRKMRATPDFADTVFIAQTGWGQPEHRELSRAAGFTRHLVKPARLEDFQKALEELPIR